MTQSSPSDARLRALAGQLIVSHESERERIAGELHDDLAQQIARLSLELGSVIRRIARHDQASLEASLLALQQQTMALADTVAALSRSLLPGLERFSLVAALERLCGDVRLEHGLAVTLDAPRDTSFTQDMARCFFRVAEEALQNVVKHAHARSANVVLSQADGQWTLAITDDGSGFDLATARQSGEGLGLFVVEERARLVRGSVHLESVAGRGTTLTIVIPA